MPKVETSKPTLELVVPSSFEFARYSNGLLHVGLRGRQLAPDATTRVALRLQTAAGEPVEAQLGPDVTLGDVAAGEGQTYFDLRATGIAEGDYKVCARAEGIDAIPCAPVHVTRKPGCQNTEAVPSGIKCQCKTAKIKGAAADGAPDPGLGKFVPGGNAPGAFDQGNWTAAGTKVSSEYKFEAHFTVAITGAPARPPGCTEEDWNAILGSVCAEGQDINRTWHTNIGTPAEKANSKRPGGTGPDVPYDPRPTATMHQDGHGYVAPTGSGDATIVDGAIKRDDIPIIHWLDVPGINDMDANDAKTFAPSRKDMYFHSYVHGSTGDPKDNCDCYFPVTSVVLKAGGAVGPSTMGAAACTP